MDLQQVSLLKQREKGRLDLLARLGVMPHPSDRKETVTLCLWLVWRMTCSSPLLLLLSLMPVSC